MTTFVGSIHQIRGIFKLNPSDWPLMWMDDEFLNRIFFDEIFSHSLMARCHRHYNLSSALNMAQLFFAACFLLNWFVEKFQHSKSSQNRDNLLFIGSNNKNFICFHNLIFKSAEWSLNCTKSFLMLLYDDQVYKRLNVGIKFYTLESD